MNAVLFIVEANVLGEAHVCKLHSTRIAIPQLIATSTAAPSIGPVVLTEQQQKQVDAAAKQAAAKAVEREAANIAVLYGMTSSRKNRVRPETDYDLYIKHLKTLLDYEDLRKSQHLHCVGNTNNYGKRKMLRRGEVI